MEPQNTRNTLKAAVPYTRARGQRLMQPVLTLIPVQARSGDPALRSEDDAFGLQARLAEVTISVSGGLTLVRDAAMVRAVESAMNNARRTAEDREAPRRRICLARRTKHSPYGQQFNAILGAILPRVPRFHLPYLPSAQSLPLVRQPGRDAKADGTMAIGSKSSQAEIVAAIDERFDRISSRSIANRMCSGAKAQSALVALDPSTSIARNERILESGRSACLRSAA